MVQELAKTQLYPVTHWQRYTLDQVAHPDCPEMLRNWHVLGHAFLFKPGIDMRRLKRAVDKLRRRHDTLRIRFVQVKGAWRAAIHPPGDNVVSEVDLSHLEGTARHAAVCALANAPLTLFDAPLAEVIVARCGPDGDVLITRVHHAITDGHGMVVLTEELTRLLLGLPLEGDAISHADYIARFQAASATDRQAIHAYWQELHQDFPKAPMIGRKAKGMTPLYDSIGETQPRTLACRVTDHSLAQMKVRSDEVGQTETTALFAGYLQALCEVYDLDRIMFMTSVSRTDPALDRYVGDHTLDPVLPFLSTDRNGLWRGVKALGMLIREAMAYLPSDTARRGSAYEAELNASGCYPSQFAAYQPRATRRQDKSAFRTGFNAAYGETVQTGPYRVTILDVRVRKTMISELQLDLGTEGRRTGFRLNYDGIAYTDAEIDTLCGAICDVLDLEQSEVVVS